MPRRRLHRSPRCPNTDWQNAVYLVFIVVCIISAKVVFKASLEFSHANSHEGLSTGDSVKFALGGADVDVGGTAEQASAANAGFGGEPAEGVALQQTVSRKAGAAGTHFTKPKKFSAEHHDAAAPIASVSTTGITVSMETGEASGEKTTLWKRSLQSPSLLIALAGYLFAISSICVSSITEFATPQEARNHVGFATQFEADGLKARLENIGGAVLWQAIGVVLMTLSQALIRHVTFGHVDLVGEITGLTQKAKQNSYGMNVSAAIVEAGGVVSAGLVAAANVYGAPKGFGSDIAAVGIFWSLSNLGFVMYTKIFDMIYINGTIGDAIEKPLEGEFEQYQIRMPHGQDSVKRGNVAVAISYACMMVSFAMILSNAVYKSYELANFGVWFVVGGLLLLIMRELLDRLIAPRRDLDDALDKKHNWGFACVIGSLQLSISRVLCSLMEDTCQDFKYTEGPGGPTDDEIAACSAQPAGVCDPCAKTIAACTSATDDSCAIAFAAAANTTSASCGSGCVYTPAGTECTIRDGACAMPDTECIAFVGASDLSLGDSILQYEFMLAQFQLQHALALVIILFFLFASKFTYQITYAIRLKAWEEGDQFQLMSQIAEHGNPAIAISFAGYLFGVGTILSGLFRDLRQLGMEVDAVQDQDFDAEKAEGVYQFTTDLLWVAIGFGMLLLVQIINDLVIFHKYHNGEELYGVTDKDGKVTGKRNVALACVEAGHYIGASFIIAACIQAENVALGLVFFGIGEVCLCLWSVMYECTTKYDDRVAIEGKNVAAGLNWGLNLVAMGLLLSRALYNSNSLWVFLVWFGCGATVMLAARKFIDYCVFPEIDLDKELDNTDHPREGEMAELTQGHERSENWGVALIAGTITISFVQCLNTFLRDCPFEENLW